MKNEYTSEIEQIMHPIRMSRFKTRNLIDLLKHRQRIGLSEAECIIMAKLYEVDISLEERLNSLTDYLRNFEDGVINEIV